MLKQSASNPASYPINSGTSTAVVTERRCNLCGGAGETIAGAVCTACRGRGVYRLR
jgi:DnaJ-class molecular chaperone